jgi:long-chain-alcohol oxidase
MMFSLHTIDVATDASPSDIEAYLKRVKARGVKKNRISMGSGHHMSSCKMGSNPKHSVVDGEGESWEVEGLFLSDGSVLPNAVGVNPMVTIQSLAYCIAHSVLQSLQSQYKTSLTKLQPFN